MSSFWKFWEREPEIAPPKKYPCSSLFCPQQFTSEAERDKHFDTEH